MSKSRRGTPNKLASPPSPPLPPRLRLGLCCQFAAEPIQFRTTTVTSLKRMERIDQLKKLSKLCLDNANALLSAFQYCVAHSIGCFRVNSQILPCKTHPDVGYLVDDLPDAEAIRSTFAACRAFASANDLRSCFHPDQYVVLNSPRPDVVSKSIAELAYQAEVAEWIGADVVNIHVGGVYGDKASALQTFFRTVSRLPDSIRRFLTVENDDTSFAPQDLAEHCRVEGIPLVYDVHHHRCWKDEWTIEEATIAAAETWDREPLFHLSSPLEGWEGPQPRRHHDYIDPRDFPPAWLKMRLTVEIEAKAKELAVEQIRLALSKTKKTEKPKR